MYIYKIYLFKKNGNKEMYFVPHVSKHKGYRMHNSDAISIVNCALDCFVYLGVLFSSRNRKFKNISCKSKHFVLRVAFVYF